MKFEEFEKKIWEMGYGIAAFNHYTIGPERTDCRTFCVILNKESNRAFRSEGKKLEEVFDDLYDQISKKE